MPEVLNNNIAPSISPTRIEQTQNTYRSTLHVFLPNGEFRSVKFGDQSDLKVSSKVAFFLYYTLIVSQISDVI